MFKELNFDSLSAIMTDFKESYEKWWHSLLKIRIGLAVEHDNFSNLPVCWRYYSHKGCGGKKWEKVCEQIDKNSEARDSRLYERWRLSGQKDKHKEEQREVRKTIQAKLQGNPLSTSQKAPKPPLVPTLAKPQRDKEKKGKEAKGKQRRSSARKSARSRGPGNTRDTRTSSSGTSRAMSPKSSRPESAGKTAGTEAAQRVLPSAEAKDQASEGESALVEPQTQDQPTSHPLENEPSGTGVVSLIPADDFGHSTSGKASTEGEEARAATQNKAEKDDVAEDAATESRENETSVDHDRSSQDEGKLKKSDSEIHLQDTRVDGSQDESSSSSSTSESDSSESDSSESDSDQSNGCQSDE